MPTLALSEMLEARRHLGNVGIGRDNIIEIDVEQIVWESMDSFQ
jgi:hypothetical protein